jgi:helicase
MRKSARRRSKGLFIGIDRYASAEINWLSCASRDATALHALFTDTLGGETTLLTDGHATAAMIAQCFDRLAASDPDDVVVIAFSGHGTETHEFVRTACLNPPVIALPRFVVSLLP